MKKSPFAGEGASGSQSLPAHLAPTASLHSDAITDPGLLAAFSSANARLSTPAADPLAAPQRPAWRSKPPSPSDLNLGSASRPPPQPFRRLPPRQHPTDPIHPATSSNPSQPPAGDRRKSQSKVEKRPLKRAYTEEEEDRGLDGAVDKCVIDLSEGARPPEGGLSGDENEVRIWPLMPFWES